MLIYCGAALIAVVVFVALKRLDWRIACAAAGLAFVGVLLLPLHITAAVFTPISLGLVVIAAAVVAIVRRVDVRLVLLSAALALGYFATQDFPAEIVRVFYKTFADERFLVPICCAMGFAYTLRHTGCDQHLVHLLVKPLTHVRFLLVPGTVLVGFVVNAPIISQTSTAASLGPVVIPILSAARLKPVTIGAVLLLGCSIGGELLNPGAPELRTVVEDSRRLLKAQDKVLIDGQVRPRKTGEKTVLTEDDVVRRILPLDLLALFTATGLFWFFAHREEARLDSEETVAEETPTDVAIDFRVNYLKAAIPFVPLLLLFVTGPPLNIREIPAYWLVDVPRDTIEVPAAMTGLFNSRRIGLAMLVGVVAAGAVAWRTVWEVPKKFFEGAGYAFTHIVSLIVTARCFGEGIKLIGLAKLLGELMKAVPWLLLPASGALAVIFGVLSGSGMATTTSLFAFFAEPAVSQNIDPTLVGAIVSLASAAGRTMSPVAAVCIMCATLTNTSPFALARRVALPLLAGVAVAVIAAVVLA